MSFVFIRGRTPDGEYLESKQVGLIDTLLVRNVCCAFTVVQGEHVKCRQIECNIAHELRGTGMKTKPVLICNIISF